VRRTVSWICAATIVAGAAGAAPAPHVAGRLTASFTYPSIPGELKEWDRWTITSRCARGPCGFDVVSQPLLGPGPASRFHFAYARGTWTQHDRAVLECGGAARGSLSADTVVLHVRRVDSQGRVLALSGSGVEHVAPTPAGAAAGCRPGTSRYHISVVVLAG
jgi:hypothetical protein